jgi:hypothetical protein
MRGRAALSILVCFICVSTSFAHVRKSSSRAIDPLYSSALAAANQFLHAWQVEDHETGIVMLSDSARQHISAEQLQMFFSPGPQAAYEIAHGRRINSGAYEFPVVLFGASSAPSYPHACTVIVTRSGKNEWTIDKLP